MPRQHPYLLIVLMVLTVSCTGDKSGKIESLRSDVLKIDKQYFSDKVTESEVFDTVTFYTAKPSRKRVDGFDFRYSIVSKQLLYSRFGNSENT